MHILISCTTTKIPTPEYGGIERVIWGLGKHLVKLKHKVTYLVAKGSSCPFAEVIEYNPLLSLNEQIPDSVDFVHANSLTQESIEKPMLFTMHGNSLINNDLLHINTVFLTKNHAERHNSSTYIFNGLDWGDYPKANLNLERTHFHFLGKASWKIKNVSGACYLASKTKNELMVMGGEKWTTANIKRGLPYLFNQKIKFLGMVNNTVKAKIASTSKGLIFPVRWHEPFGLAVVESLYYGSPVFTTKYGALDELVNKDVGFTSNNKKELIYAMNNSNFTTKQCHEYARDNFNSEIMTNNYLKLYEKILNGESLNSEKPYLIDSKNNSLLDFS